MKDLDRQERYAKILGWFGENMPVAQSELHYDNPFQLLVAVILSAQCTDKRVNMHTPEIFRKYPTPEIMAKASFEDVYQDIKSITYPNSKAKYLISAAQLLVSAYDGKVPDNPDELVKLPGVGRKTANVVASIIYDKPVIAVDTHVFRVARRLGLSDGSTVEKVEKDLTENIPEELRARAHHWLILHGRYVCKARKPECGTCGLKDLCRFFTTKN